MIDPTKRYYLKIDAASKAANVKVNGQVAGNHAGGYSAFILDVTGLIRKENEIEIIVDNARRDITPLWADFTFWGGIYRDVWLISLRSSTLTWRITDRPVYFSVPPLSTTGRE